MMMARLASLLATLTPVAAHRPWPRFQVDAETWTSIGVALGEGGGDLVGLWGDVEAVHLALRVPEIEGVSVVSVAVADNSFPSIGRHHAPASQLERTIHDLYGFVPRGAADERGWLDHGAWGVSAPLVACTPADLRDPADYEFLRVEGEGLHQIAVGPVHAGIIEPGHFRFTANGETVARLEERLGYAHKGVDALVSGADLDRAQRIVTRVSGDSTVALGFAFARAVEAALDIVVPPRAQVIRGVMAELERLANHFGDIGAICNDASFALIHAHCGIYRERILAAADAVFAHRLMMDEIMPGGVAQDISAAGVRAILEVLDEIAPEFAEIVRLYDDTPSLQDRTCTTGIVSRELVTRWAAGGFVGRGSGRDFDARRDLAYFPYDGAVFAVPVIASGDVDARVRVRIREVDESMKLIRAWLAALPPGAILADMPPVEEACEGMAIVESFRGDLLVWLRIGADGRIARCHVRDASWMQWPLLEAAIENNIVADFPLCNKSFNCSYSGHDL
jgi:Ni,Fe-hydrogenase III large subunit